MELEDQIWRNLNAHESWPFPENIGVKNNIILSNRRQGKLENIFEYNWKRTERLRQRKKQHQELSKIKLNIWNPEFVFQDRDAHYALPEMCFWISYGISKLDNNECKPSPKNTEHSGKKN